MNYYLIKVKDYMWKTLPRPRLRDDVLDKDRAESLRELNIIIDGFFAC